MKSELVWERWEPLKEFTKTLVLKNVHSKLQKLNVRSDELTDLVKVVKHGTYESMHLPALLFNIFTLLGLQLPRFLAL